MCWCPKGFSQLFWCFQAHLCHQPRCGPGTAGRRCRPGVSEEHSGGLASSGWEHSGEPSEAAKGSTRCLPCKTKWNLSKILPLFLSLSSTKTTKGILFPYYEEKAKFLMVLSVAFRNHKGWWAWQTVVRAIWSRRGIVAWRLKGVLCSKLPWL